MIALLVLAELRHAWLAHKSTAEIEAALEGIEGPEDGPKMPRSHLVIPPLAFVTRGVNRTRGVKFAEVDGMKLRLDVYRPADDDPDDDLIQPAVIQVHGGGWLAGSRFEQGIPLLNHMASIGWVGFNIDYRLSPQATFPDHVVDVKRAIAWVRENAEELGIDPEMICLTGGSAGGHLTALAALTAGRPRPAARLRGRRHLGCRRRPVLRRLRPHRRQRLLLPADALLACSRRSSSSASTRRPRTSTARPRRPSACTRTHLRSS